MCAPCLAGPEPLSGGFFCASCRIPFLNRFPLDENGQCALCRLGARAYEHAYCFGSYEGTLRELIHLFKFSGMRPLVRPLGAFLFRALPVDAEFDLVTPVPLHWRRLWSRGFNQSALLAGYLAKRRSLPVVNALRRGKNTATQTGLTSAQRRKNLSGAVALRKRARGRIRDKRVLLVDDVLTTGATGNACAAVLKRGGARSVTLVTLARTDRRFQALPQQAGNLALGA